MTLTQKQTRTDWPRIFLQGDFGLISIFSVLPDWVIVSHLLLWKSCQQLDPESVTCRFKSPRGRFTFGEITPTSMSAKPTEAGHLKVLLGCKTKEENAVKTLNYGVTYLGREPSFSLTHVTHSHTQRSRAHSAHSPLRCKWVVSTHHWPNATPSPPLSSVHHSSTPDILLGFALSSSLCHTVQLSHSLFFVSLLPQEHRLKIFTQCKKKWSIRTLLLWSFHTILTSIYLKCIQPLFLHQCPNPIYISWWSYPSKVLI